MGRAKHDRYKRGIHSAVGSIDPSGRMAAQLNDGKLETGCSMSQYRERWLRKEWHWCERSESGRLRSRDVRHLRLSAITPMLLIMSNFSS